VKYAAKGTSRGKDFTGQGKQKTEIGRGQFSHNFHSQLLTFHRKFEIMF
jgi:hypothetical protein